MPPKRQIGFSRRLPYSSAAGTDLVFLEAFMKVFTLYVGASHPSAKATLLGLLERHFESFTVISGEGYFRGAAEPM
jgi:hypothetical protein